MQKPAQGYNLAGKLTELTKPVADLAEGLLASAIYDGDLRLAVLKFYDAKAGRFWLWRDNTGHKPYCVEGDTLLLGDNKTIAEVCEGNQVLGLRGHALVSGKVVRPYEGKMVRVHACGLLPFRITPEHPVLVARSKASRNRLTEFGTPCWKLPADLQPKLSRNEGDYLVMPVARPQYDTDIIPLTKFSRMRSGWLKVKELPIKEETAWLLGLYVAEGSSGGRRGAVFSLSKDEAAIRNRISSIAKEIGYSAHSIDNGKHSVRVHLGGAVMARAMDEWCGHGARNKKIPDFI
ncbi:MAG: hypothetical protein LYZ69_00005, partial [Nitrososphaerales archaeon]|nr:hypothetical protein [Nitrososphaerales archaeon]